MSFLFTIILLAIAVYVLYSAITGKGKLFATENIQEDKIGQFLKLIRPIYGVLGVLLLLMAALSGFQNAVYAENVYRFTDDFPKYYGEFIDAKGNVTGTTMHVDGVYGYNQMAAAFQSFGNVNLPEGVQPVEVLTDENGAYLYLGVGETELNQNAAFAAMRSALPYQATQILTWVLMGVAVLVVVGIFVLMRKFTDKEKAAKAREQAVSGRSPKMPSSAFEFEEDESDAGEKKE